MRSMVRMLGFQNFQKTMRHQFIVESFSYITHGVSCGHRRPQGRELFPQTNLLEREAELCRWFSI